MFIDTAIDFSVGLEVSCSLISAAKLILTKLNKKKIANRTVNFSFKRQFKLSIKDYHGKGIMSKETECLIM